MSGAVAERPTPQDAGEVEKLDVIDQICADNNATHCLPRLLLLNLERLLPCPYIEGGCQGRGWCDNRQALLEGKSARYLAQAKMIEREQWILGYNGHHPETYRRALRTFSDMKYGNGTVFAYAWEDLGIRDLGTLERTCVHAVIDNAPIVETPAQPATPETNP
jgi:hypothetical protein